MLPTLRRLPLLAGCVLAFAACQDPSGVGLTLIGDETTDPNTRLVATDSLFASEQTEPTGGFADGSGSPVQTRLLFGAFTDDILGDTRATAYLDARNATGSSAFEERAVEQVQVELVRSIVYGDTLGTVPVEIREVTASWNPEGLPTDTTLTTGDLLATGTVSAQDSVVTLDLPQSFIDANDLAVGDSIPAFFQDFEGFQLTVPDGSMSNAVVGFNAAASHLVFIGEEYDDDGDTVRDTVRYDLVEVYTALARTEADEVTDRFLLRDGDSDVLGFRFNVDDLTSLPIANASIRIPIDRAAVETPDGFNRPLPTIVTLFAMLDDGTRAVVLEANVPASGDVITIQDRDLTVLMQSILLGRQSIQYLEIGHPPSPLGLSVLPILVEEEATPTPGSLRRPRLSILTVGSPA
ncbi:MAG: hypothetical protein AAF791_12630 [Bacteroidota bacterium]